MGRRQVARHRILIPTFGGSSPSGGAKFLAVRPNGEVAS